MAWFAPGSHDETIFNNVQGPVVPKTVSFNIVPGCFTYAQRCGEDNGPDWPHDTPKSGVHRIFFTLGGVVMERICCS